MKNLFYLFFYLGLFANPLFLFAQEEEKVTLERAEVLEKTKDNPNVRKLINRVIVKHKGSVLYCDSAYLHEERNQVDAYGNARLIGADGTRLNSDSMYYDGNSQIARAVGKVTLLDDGMKLNTEELDYNMEEGVAYYYSGGKIVDADKTLESQAGSYDVNAKIFYFKKDVELVMRSDGRTVETDNLTYNTISKIAFFEGPTWISSPNGKVYTELGNFNTETEASNFTGRSRVEDEKYILEGDTLFFDNNQRIGNAYGNVWMFSKQDSLIIEGDMGWFRGEQGITKVYGNALLRSISKGDTLFLKADTLLSVDHLEDSTRYMTAYPKSQLYSRDFQAKCDSLVYNRMDSVIYFYRDPVLWNEDSQLSADSLHMQMANNQISQLVLKKNAFMISEDTLKNYNQLKGKNMRVYFTDNEIRKLEVRGNGQNIYFALDKDTILVGMNRIECSDMNIYFQIGNSLEKIAYINKPDAVFVPPHEIVEPQTRLKNFQWRIEERPLKEKMFRPQVYVLLNKIDKTYIKGDL